MMKMPAKGRTKLAVLKTMHAFGMILTNFGIEIQVAVATKMGVPHPRQAVRSILIDILLQHFKEEAAELGVPEEEVMPVPRDMSGLH